MLAGRDIFPCSNLAHINASIMGIFSLILSCSKQQALVQMWD
ncbi:hypothetical protein BVRB_4g077130 [Beta vulgaris subsp. vulgaris]|nr:hypothetical protein BVRB_4g077130 [Beta vulgaris subsp. vulgaris]